MNKNTTTHVLNEPSTGSLPPQTASKPPRVLKKRGRKGNKIDTAFKEIPQNAVDFAEYATAHGVTTNVLRQIKRHDQYKETGKVFVRKNKTTGKIMIWRETSIKD